MQVRFLQDYFDGSGYYQAGTVATMPANWIPTVNCDPLDTAAVNAFFAAGPKLTGLVRQQWSTVFVAPPVTRWIPGPGAWQWSLTGLGASLGPTSGVGSLSLP
jgi:hypothetical protein